MAVLAGTSGPLPATDTQASGTDHPALVIGGGASLRVKPGTRLTLDCDLRNYGTFTAADGSRVVVNGFGAPSLRGVTQFADLQMAMHGTAWLANDCSVNGQLFLTGGNLSVAGHDLSVTSIIGGSADSYVATPDTLGRLVRSVGYLDPVHFPIGNTTFNPVSVRRTSGLGVLRVAAPVIGDACSAGEADAAIDEQGLAMRPVVEAPQRVPVNGVEPGQLAPARLEHLEDVGPDRRGTDGIEQDLHRDAGARPLGQRVREHQADVAGPVDVRLDRHRPLGRADGVEHRRVELVAVVEHADPVTANERGPGRALDAVDERLRPDRHAVVEAIDGWPLLRRREVHHDGEHGRDAREEPPVGGRRPDSRGGPQPPREQHAARPCPQAR